MKIGLLAYSSNTGLGYQSLDFYTHMQPSKVLVADLSIHNHVSTHHERFDPSITRIDKCISRDYLSEQSCEWLVDGMDVIFVMETPLNHYLFNYAHRKRVKIVLQYNYEFLAYFRRPDLPKPHILASPTSWGIEVVRSKGWSGVVHWPVPIDTTKFQPRRIEEVETFTHIVGRPAAHDRNGTVDFLDAAIMLGKDFKYKLFLQPPVDPQASRHFTMITGKILKAKSILGSHLEVIQDVVDNQQMYAEGDVLVLPRKYGGLCLPMWEALSVGMPVIMPNISPNETILPAEWRVSSQPGINFMAHTKINTYNVRPEDLAMRMISVASDIKSQSKRALELAHSMSWSVQKQNYISRLTELIL